MRRLSQPGVAWPWGQRCCGQATAGAVHARASSDSALPTSPSRGGRADRARLRVPDGARPRASHVAGRRVAPSTATTSYAGPARS